MIFLISDQQVALINKIKINQMDSAPVAVFSSFTLLEKRHQDWLTEGVKTVGLILLSCLNLRFC